MGCIRCIIGFGDSNMTDERMISTEQRNAGIDLLRILSIFFVVLLHFSECGKQNMRRKPIIYKRE